MPLFHKLPATIATMVECVKNWNEFSFSHAGHEYRVAGGVIGEDTEGHPILFADLLEVDGQPQKGEPLMRFDLLGTKSQVRKGALRAQRSNDYTKPRESLAWVYAAGPIGRRKSPEDFDSRSKTSRSLGSSEARRKLESLFRK